MAYVEKHLRGDFRSIDDILGFYIPEITKVDTPMAPPREKGVISWLKEEVKDIGRTVKDVYLSVPSAYRLLKETRKVDEQRMQNIEALARDSNISAEEITKQIYHSFSSGKARSLARNRAIKARKDLKKKDLKLSYKECLKEGVNAIGSDTLAAINLLSKTAFTMAGLYNPAAILGIVHGFKKADQGARWFIDKFEDDKIKKLYDGKEVFIGEKKFEGNELKEIVKQNYANSYSTILSGLYFAGAGALAAATLNPAAAVPLARGIAATIAGVYSGLGIRDIVKGNFGQNTAMKMAVARDLQTLNTALYAASALPHYIPGILDIKLPGLDLSKYKPGSVQHELSGTSSVASTPERAIVPQSTINLAETAAGLKGTYNVFSDFFADQFHGLANLGHEAYDSLTLSPFEKVAKDHPTEPLWGLLAGADKNHDGIVTGNEIKVFLEGRGDASQLQARYDHLRDFMNSVDSQGHKGVSIDDTNNFFSDYHSAYQHNFRNSQRVHHNVGELQIVSTGNNGARFHFQFNDSPDTAKLLHNLEQDKTVGFTLDKSDVVVRVFELQPNGKLAPTPIAIADIGSDGFSSHIIYTNAMHPTDAQLLAGILNHQAVAEASYLDRQGSHDANGVAHSYCPNQFGDDIVHIFDTEGRQPANHPGKIIKVPGKPRIVKLPPPNFPTHGIPSGAGDTTTNLVDFTTDIGWDGFAGKHHLNDYKDKTLYSHDGDMVSYQPSHFARTVYGDSVGTHTTITDHDGHNVYGKKTLGTKILNSFLPKEKEHYNWKVCEKQDGSRGEQFVLNSNQGSVFGTGSRHPDELRVNYRAPEVHEGITIFGKSYTRLGGAQASPNSGAGQNNHINDYQAHVTVGYDNPNSSADSRINPTIIGKTTQNLHTEPMSNTTAYALGVMSGAAGTYGTTLLTGAGPTGASTVVNAPKILGNQTTVPGIVNNGAVGGIQ